MLIAGLWTGMQILAGCGTLDDTIREQLVRWKNLMGIVFFAAAALAAPASIRLSRVAIVAGVFPFYAACNLFCRGILDGPVIVLYGVWWWGFFVVVPGVFRSPPARQRLIEAIVVAAVVATAFGIARGIGSDQLYWWDDRRLVFSFTNPIYFGYCGITLAIGALFLRTARAGPRHGPASRMVLRFAYPVLGLVGCGIILGARARNGLLFLGVFALTYVVSGRRYRMLLSTFIALVMVISIVVLSGADNVVERLDDLSSGRLRLWQTLVGENVGSMAVRDVFFGVGEFEQRILGSNDALAAEARYTRAHSDNAYLDIFLSLGMTGLALFLLPLSLVGRALLRVGGVTRGGRFDVPTETRIAAATLFGLLAQGVVVSNIPSLGNPINILCMSLIMAVWGSLEPGTRRSPVAVATETARPRDLNQARWRADLDLSRIGR